MQLQKVGSRKSKFTSQAGVDNRGTRIGGRNKVASDQGARIKSSQEGPGLKSISGKCRDRNTLNLLLPRVS